MSRPAAHGLSLCPYAPGEFPVFDFTSLGNLICTTEQCGDGVHMNGKEIRGRKKKTAVFFIMLESMWICPTPAAGECRAVYLTLL